MYHKKFLTLLSGAALVALTPQAYAAGFYIQEQSVSGLGNAYAGQVAKSRDSSVVYYNPAGMARLKQNSANVGVHIIAPSANITDTGTTNAFGAVGGGSGNPYDPTPVPNFNMSYEAVEDTLWLGLAVSAPFGLANDYGNEWFGRFDSTATELTTYDIQPSIAYKINEKLSIGGGVNLQHASAKLESVINQGAGDLNSILDGKDNISFGYNFGMMYEPMPGTVLGAHYRSSIHHSLKGDVTSRNATTGAIVPGVTYDATVQLNLPEIVQLGIDQKINDKLSVQAGATWFGWNSFNEIRVVDSSGARADNVTTQNYQTTWAFSVGGEYELNEDWTLRAGYQYDETPTTDEFRTTRTPDGDRHWFATGATYNINDDLSLDMAAVYISVSEENINLTRNSLNTVSAQSEQDIGIISVGLNYKF
ncbi:MAG: OmpP1/FadL family transporter [Alphaproteobacteria bacterium]